MKNIIIAVVALALLGTAIYFTNQPEEINYTAPTAISTTEVIEVDALQELIKSAQEDGKEQIEQEAERIKQEAIKQANLEIELAVRTQYREELEVKEKELQAQSVAY